MRNLAQRKFTVWGQLLCFAVLLGILCPVIHAASAEQDLLSRLDQALKSVPSFEYGKDAGALQQIEQIVFESSNRAELQPAVEERLLRVLGGNATRDAKEFICRQLFTIGTDRSVPALEQLLTDPALSHMARFALGRNESPDASAALLRAASKTSGKVQAGILDTLGQRRYEPALQEARSLLSSPEPVVAQAAVGALGALSTIEAVKALQAARPKAQPDLRKRINEALLLAADHLLERGMQSAAAGVYAELYAPTESVGIRIAALRGLLESGDSRGVPMLTEAIRSGETRFAYAAIGICPSARDPKATSALASLLSVLPPDSQELLLKALATRKDPASARVVAELASSTNANVRVSALEALGTVGDDSQADLLLRAAGGLTGREQQCARASLAKLERGDVNAALIRRVGSGDTREQAEAIRALAARGATAAVPQLIKAANSSEEVVRREALRALGAMVDASRLQAFAALALQLEERDFDSFEQALETALQRVRDPEQRAAPVLNTLAGAPPQKQPPLIRVLPQCASRGALAAAQASLNSENPQVRSAGVRALADWPDAAPAESLLAQVQTAASPADKIVALRGYIRMAGRAKDPAAMYARALQLAERPEDKRLVLSGLGSAEPLQALELVRPFLKNELLCDEAALAAVQIADRLRAKDPVRAKTVAKEALAVSTEPRIRQQGQEVINQIEQFEGYILEWVIAGPFQAEGKDAHALFDMVFPPEQPGADAKWSKLTRGVGAWDINLGDAMGGGDDVVGYLRTHVFVDSAQEARLELGSDDGIKVWENGIVVHVNNTERGIAPRQDIVKVNLNQGWNVLLLKVTNRAGGWNAACRLRRPDGSAIEGMKVDPQ